LRAKVAAGRSAQNRGRCEQADDSFHLAVAQVSRNPVLIGFLAYLSGARRRAVWQREWDRTYRHIGAGEFHGVHSDQNDRVVDAIAAHDPDAALAAMTLHLETIEAAMRGTSR
jgi:DNA-binding FadR family transcriptional regulator